MTDIRQYPMPDPPDRPLDPPEPREPRWPRKPRNGEQCDPEDLGEER